MKRRIPYIVTALITFVIGILIFKYATPIPFLRHSLGDFIVVIFLYAAVKSLFPKTSRIILVLGVLIFSVSIEVLQFFQFPQLFGTDKAWVKLLLGSNFQWSDILAYFLGIMSIYWLDKELFTNSNK